MRPLPINSHDSVFVLTGAGVSAESGIPTFRDVGGYWRDRNIADVASPRGWEKDPQLVWDFYSERRRTARRATPNEAHQTIAAWQRWLPCPVTVCTQNVDPLHVETSSSPSRRARIGTWNPMTTPVVSAAKTSNAHAPDCGALAKP